MAWHKKPKLVGSCSVGYQSFNDIVEALEQLRDDYLVEHSSGDTPEPPPGLLPKPKIGDVVSGIGSTRLVSPGRHNSPLIAVGVGHVTYDSAVDTTIPNFRWGSSEAFGSITRIAVGKYIIASRGIDTVAGRVTVRQTSNTYAYTTLAIPLVGGTSNTSPTGLAVFISSNAGGPMDYADSVPFSVHFFRRTPIVYESDPY